MTITFGPSQDAEGVIMVDCIKIYGKTKDMFGWPEEPEDTSAGQTSTTQAVVGIAANNDTENQTSPTTLTCVDK